jgi:hypothetical protein
VPDLLHQLDVDRNAAGGIQSEQSGLTVSQLWYSSTLGQSSRDKSDPPPKPLAYSHRLNRIGTAA